MNLLTFPSVHQRHSVPNLLQALRAEGATFVRVRERMMSTQVTVSPEADIRRVKSLMRQKKVSAVAVVDARGKVIGVLTADRIEKTEFEKARSLIAWETMTVAHLMSTEVTTVDPDSTLREAAGVMLEGGFRHLPVIDAKKTLLGMLSERDLRSFLGTELRNYMNATRGLDEPISSVMNPNPTAFRMSTPLAEALDVFSDERIGAVPILNDEDVLVGILSYVDVLEWLQRHPPLAVEAH